MRYRLIPTSVLAGLVLIIAALMATARAQHSGSTLESTPGEITAAAPLGGFATAELTLRNTGSEPLIAYLYEQPLQDSGAPDSAQQLTPLRVALPDQPERVDPQIEQELAQAEDGRVTVLIFLRDQADLSAAASVPGWRPRGAAVQRTLVEHAERSQGSLRALLAKRGVRFRPFWIVNAIAVEADRALIAELAGHSDVALLRADHRYPLSRPLGGADTAAPEPGWNIRHIGAERVHTHYGVTGQGIVVANIDSGVAYSHTALLGRYRGYDPNGTLRHDYNWFDPTGVFTTTPADGDDHGTHTMGTMVGAATDTMPAIGVAPEARWVAARGCDTIFCQDTWLIAAAEWLLAPTDLQGNNPRPELRPHIVNNSWGRTGSDRWYAGYVTAWNAAGIFSTFSAGNSGFMGCQTILVPAAYPESFAVGATDSADLRAFFSSRGPTSDGLIKPDISAPGVDIISSIPGNGYQAQSGTSMAAPHVAGLAALIWSSNPSLIGDIAATREIIRQSALALPSGDCSDGPQSVPNQAYGWGRIDAFAAVTQARRDLPWLSAPDSVSLAPGQTAAVPLLLDARLVTQPGSYQALLLLGTSSVEPLQAVTVTFTVSDSSAALLSGRLNDRWTGEPVIGQVALEGGPLLLTDASGVYSLTLEPASYTLVATAYGYRPMTATLSLQADTTFNWVLTPDTGHLVLDAPPISTTLAFGEQATFALTATNLGPRPLQIDVSVPPLEYSVTQRRAGEPPASWYDLSAVPPLPLDDDTIYTDALALGFQMPVYGSLQHSFYLSSNGWISFSKPSGAQPGSRCFPTLNLPNKSFAPLWLDLDPSQGGAVRASQVDNDTFVVSFEDVPRWARDPSTSVATYTFQLELNRSGIIRYHYRHIGALPDNYTVGVQHFGERGQSFHCGSRRTAPPAAGQVIEIEGQPLPSIWLSSDTSSLILEPGQSALLQTQLRGLSPWPWRTQPYSANLQLQTSDPLQPRLALPTNLQVQDAPYLTALPLVGR